MESNVKQAIKEELEATRAEWNELLGGVAADQWNRLAYSEGSEWRVVDILRHVADSERGMTALIVRIQEGGEGVPPDFDLHRWNKRAVEKLGDKGPDELLAGMTASREALLEVIETLQDEDWDKRGRHASLRIMSIEEVCRLIASHEAGHLAVIREALAA
ncbi:MAG TPA: DinB family protein [Promineifilum sp.]